MCRISFKKHYSNSYISKLKKPNESNIRKWVNFHKTYGRIGLLPRENQNYTIDFKLKAKTIMKESLSKEQAQTQESNAQFKTKIT
jgi:transposase